jgi:hypothetical protein
MGRYIRTISAKSPKGITQGNPLERKSDRRKEQVRKKKIKPVHLDEIEVSIVTFLALARPPQQATLAQIAHFLGASTIKAEVLLRKLEEKAIVNHTVYVDGRKPTYGLDQHGQEHAVAIGIVK